MEIDWFWLTVIIFIISITIVAVVGKYLHYKWKKYRWLNDIEEEEKSKEEGDPI